MQQEAATAALPQDPLPEVRRSTRAHNAAPADQRRRGKPKARQGPKKRQPAAPVPGRTAVVLSSWSLTRPPVNPTDLQWEAEARPLPDAGPTRCPERGKQPAGAPSGSGTAPQCARGQQTQSHTGDTPAWQAWDSSLSLQRVPTPGRLARAMQCEKTPVPGSSNPGALLGGHSARLQLGAAAPAAPGAASRAGRAPAAAPVLFRGRPRICSGRQTTNSSGAPSLFRSGAPASCQARVAAAEGAVHTCVAGSSRSGSRAGAVAVPVQSAPSSTTATSGDGPNGTWQPATVATKPFYTVEREEKLQESYLSKGQSPPAAAGTAEGSTTGPIHGSSESPSKPCPAGGATGAAASSGQQPPESRQLQGTPGARAAPSSWWQVLATRPQQVIAGASDAARSWWQVPANKSQQESPVVSEAALTAPQRPESRQQLGSSGAGPAAGVTSTGKAPGNRQPGPIYRRLLCSGAKAAALLPWVSPGRWRQASLALLHGLPLPLGSNGKAGTAPVQQAGPGAPCGSKQQRSEGSGPVGNQGCPPTNSRANAGSKGARARCCSHCGCAGAQAARL